MHAAVNTEPSSPSSVSPADSGLAFELADVTVGYRSYRERPSSLKETLIRFFRTGKLKHYSTFNALDSLTLTIPKGQVFGIIGSNGSGKSTLLKVLAQVLKPTSGTVRVNGSIASLIELGVGFDPELNAIENIYLNGSLFKKSRKEIEKRVDIILDFAELREFATTPIKYYSSGMAARLGFAAAIDIDPDILLVDEILAVGDERFHAKCGEVFKRFLASGKTIVIVSHDMNLIQSTAQQAVLLSKGKVVYHGSPQKAVELYRDDSYRSAL
jgi:ABC-type polysaccharide/polyol phosphate transport system ATPase subunit